MVKATKLPVKKYTSHRCICINCNKGRKKKVI